MRYSFILTALLAGASSAAILKPRAAACAGKFISTLDKCSTASAFCSSYLSYAPGSTYTTTEYVTATDASATTMTLTKGKNTVYVTSTLIAGTTTFYTTTTITAPTATVTSPSISGNPSCYVSTISGTGTGVAVAAAAAVTQTSCGFNKQPAASISSACSCYVDDVVTSTKTQYRTTVVKTTVMPTETLTLYSTSSTTSTSTYTQAGTTVTHNLPACATPDRSCSNAGLQWAYDVTSQPCTSCSNAGCSTGPYNPSDIGVFDPTLYKNATPVISGTTSDISIGYTTGSGTGYFYGQGPESESYFVINHRGYFYPPQTGVYNFTYNFVDDDGFLWVGPTAYSGWTASNTNYYMYWGTPTYTAQINLTAATYYPIRILYGQGCGTGGFGLTIVAPDGETVTQSANGITSSPYLVQFSCDGVSAPAYPAYGQET